MKALVQVTRRLTPRTKLDNLFYVVLVTCPPEASEKIARAVLDAHAAACVNILPGVRSLYLWKGKVEDVNECLLLMKTRKERLVEFERVVRRAHPYDVPEIMALPVTHGFHPYLDWIARSTEKS
jgi:periplasmic divalent cation tolerance protein